MITKQVIIIMKITSNNLLVPLLVVVLESTVCWITGIVDIVYV